jgi:hypothetical protein
VRSIAVLIGLNLVISFLLPGISWQVHVGGLITGAVVALVFSLAGFLYVALGIVSGPLADRWGARRLCIAGMLLVGAGLALASVARNIVEVYAAYGLGVGLGVGLAYVPAVGAVPSMVRSARARRPFSLGDTTRPPSPSSGTTFTAPRPSNSAASLARQKGEDWMAVTVMPRSRSAAPRVRDWDRPVSFSCRWVVQSARLKGLVSAWSLWVAG